MTRWRRGVIVVAAVLITVAVLVTGWLVRWSQPDDSALTGSPTRSLSPSGARPSSPAPLPRPSTAAPSPTGSAKPEPGRRWAPVPGQPWQWQLTTPVDLSVDVPVYDIDGFDNSAAVVRALHQRGRKVICYVEVGAAEDFRPDYRSFPKDVLGKSNGWDGERWVDIRRLDVLGPIIAKRFDMCKAKGFDAIEPDLMDSFSNDTGFPITAAHQLTFNRFVARLAHERGLAVALKNDPAQVEQLIGDVDFAVVEECAKFRECDRYLPFIRAGKAVLHVEYNLDRSAFCGNARAQRFSSMRKSLDLTAARQPC